MNFVILRYTRQPGYLALTGRQRRASESDTLMDVRPLAVGARGNVDILQMLSKAQDEYDKVKLPSSNQGTFFLQKFIVEYLNRYFEIETHINTLRVFHCKG